MQKAKELMYTGRPVGAQEAKDIGIAMEVYPSDNLYDRSVAKY